MDVLRSKRHAVGALLVLAGLVGTTSGCALNARVDVLFTGAAVKESSASVEFDPHRVHGVTGHRRAVGINCSLTVAYDANDIGGPGVIVQTKVFHLRTRRVSRGTAYDLDCSGPLIVELPKDATAIQATAAGDSGQAMLPVQPSVRSLRIAFGKHLRAQRGMQLVLIRRPDALPTGDYRIDLSFDLAAARPIREKLLYAATVSCGRSSYVEPLVPAVSKMKRARGVTIQPSASAYSLKLPRIAGARENGVPLQTSRRLSC